MSIHTETQEGFSAAELLITLFIGALFLIAGSQLYITVINEGRYSDRQTVASTASLAHLNRLIDNAVLYPTTCASLPVTYNTNWAYGPYDFLTFQITYACPDATNFPDVRKLTIKGTNEGVSASHATYYIEP